LLNHNIQSNLLLLLVLALEQVLEQVKVRQVLLG
jgi:hypothetical protein